MDEEVQSNGLWFSHIPAKYRSNNEEHWQVLIKFKNSQVSLRKLQANINNCTEIYIMFNNLLILLAVRHLFEMQVLFGGMDKFN